MPKDEVRPTAGVDVTLIDGMLRLTPKQRLEQNDRMATLAVRLRAAVEAGRGRRVVEETLKRRRG